MKNERKTKRATRVGKTTPFKTTSLALSKYLQGKAKQLAQDAHTAHMWLGPILRASAAAQGAYAFKERLKKPHQICDKVLRKRKDKDPKYTPQRVTDISGFRIVSLFNADIPGVLDRLLQLFDAPRPSGDPGRFKDRCVSEIVFHSSRRSGDPLSILDPVKRIVGRNRYQLRVVEEASSYSSVHLIVNTQVREGNNVVNACSEIQLRSVFEEAWSEISHRLNYGPDKQARARGTESPSTFDPQKNEIFLHLDALKSLSDGCAQYADLINAQIARLRSDAADREPRSIESPEEGMELFKSCGKLVRERVAKALDLRSKAENLPREDPKRAETYLAASKKFTKALEKLNSSSGISSVPIDDLRSFLKEEIAFCKMFSGNAELRSQAETAYRELLNLKSGKVSVLLRLGQLRRDAGDYNEARALMEQCVTFASESAKTPSLARLKWILLRDLGYVYWRIADTDAEQTNTLELLQKAADLTRNAAKTAANEEHFLNASLNLLYYLTELDSRVAAESRRAIVGEAKQILEEVKKHNGTENWRTTWLDSLLRAEHLFGEKEEARKWAATVLRRFDEKISSKAVAVEHPIAARDLRLLSPDDRDMYQYAQRVLAVGG